MGQLTGKQQSFIHAYLGEARFNATAAAKIAGYKATSKHSFESIGSENLLKPEIRRVLDEHWKLSRMSAEECLGELTKLARGNSKDQIRALALLSQHHGLLDGRGRDEEIQTLATQMADQRIQEWADEVDKDVQEYNQKALANNERKDKQWKAIVERYKHSSEAVEALELMFRVMKDLEDIEPYEEPPPPKPEPTEVEIIPPSRRLQPAAVERLMAEVIEVESSPAQQPAWCPPDKCFCPKTSDKPNIRSGFPIPCGHGYHGGCAQCSSRYA
jgi:phage terminase small subunit